jgi:hypothetical protein
LPDPVAADGDWLQTIYAPDPIASAHYELKYWDGNETVDNDGTREWPGYRELLGMTT